MRIFFASILVAVALAACSAHSNTSTASPSPTSPITFPLYDGSSVVASHTFAVTVDRANLRTYGPVFPAGTGIYTDRELIAENAASFDDLSRWIARLTANPPAGYVASPDRSNFVQAQAQMAADGIDFAVFEPQGAQPGGDVLVTVIDPAVVGARAGLAMGVIANYRSLPPVLRDAVDARVKKEYGMTASELIDPAMPIGQALAAFEAVKDSGQRAIVVVDARKQ
jgi:hypothetical protein